MPPGRRFGKYLLHDRIAVGGMGELFLATLAGAARGTPPVVLKILLPEFSDEAEFVSMFHDEARVGMQLAHHNVVAVYDIGRVGESSYIVLEYVHGENLRALQNTLEDRGEKFPIESALRIAIEVLHGLDHAHRAKDGRGKSMNLVHRDLSPDNVMISFDGDVKVLDFGIAKSDGRATQTQFGILKGKVQYMAPEQALGAPVDARTDIYAIGLVLLEILTRERRFVGESDPVQMIRDARTWTPRPLTSIDPTLPGELDTALMKALEREPENRWQSAEEFATALTRLLRGPAIPRAKEHLPDLLRRVFPDRAEPFLQVEDVPNEKELLGVFLSRGKPGATTSKTSPEQTESTVPSAPASNSTDDTVESEVDSTRVGVATLDDDRTAVKVSALPARPSKPVAGMRVSPAPSPPPPPRAIPPPPSAPSGRRPDRAAIPDGQTSLGVPSLPAAAPSSIAPVPEGRARKSSPPPPAKPSRPAEDEELADREEVGTRVGIGILENRTATTRKAAVDGDSATRSSRPAVRRTDSRGSSFLLVGMAFVLVVAGVGIVLRKPIQARLAAMKAGPLETPSATGEEASDTATAAETPQETAVAIADTPEEPVETPVALEATPTPNTAVVAATARPAPTATKAGGAAKSGGRFPGEIVDDEELPTIPTEEPVETPVVVAATAPPAPGSTKRAKPTPTAVAAATTATAGKTASVRILSKPAGMEILIDGNATGKRTPATVQVEPGSRILSLRAPGFKAWSFSEDFAAGDTLQLQADLKPE